MDVTSCGDNYLRACWRRECPGRRACLRIQHSWKMAAAAARRVRAAVGSACQMYDPRGDHFMTQFRERRAFLQTLTAGAAFLAVLPFAHASEEKGAKKTFIYKVID